MAMAGLLVEDWSGKKIDNIESTMFQGAFVKASKDPAPVSDGFGRSIPGPDEQPAAKIAKTSAKPKRNSTVTFEE
jgi:hypothetical protein